MVNLGGWVGAVREITHPTLAIKHPTLAKMPSPE